jgi:hypothetical protein
MMAVLAICFILLDMEGLHGRGMHAGVTPTPPGVGHCNNAKSSDLQAV